MKRFRQSKLKQLTSIGFVLLLFISAQFARSGERGDLETPRLKSATPLSPDELYDIALHYNPDHRKNVETATLAGIKLRSAWGSLLPTIGVNYQISQNNYYNPTYTNPDGSVSTYPKVEETYQTVIDTINGHIFWGLDPNSPLSITYPIPEGESRSSFGWISLQETINLGGQQLFSIRNARLQNRMNELQVSSSELELRYDVRQSYYNVLAQKRLLELAQRVLEQKREQLHLAQARYEVGSVTELDVLQAEIDVGNQENAVIEAQNNLKMAREALNQVLGVQLDSQYELEDNFSIFQPEFSLPDLVKEAILHRPDLRLYQDQERYQLNSVRSARGKFLPNLSASISHSRSENSGGNVPFTFNPRNRNTQMSLTLSWNLFSGFSDQEQYEESRVALNNARYDRKKQEQQVEKEVREAYYALIQTFDQSKVTEKNRELAARQLALEQERYRLGATSQLNLRAAQVTYEQAETDHISNIFSFWSNLAALERAVGRKLH